ncbi:hypothetical protein C2G38_2235805 [Gigaspora rosea]|uniref:Uncharacterized protein n=1 Tax=Gigaspora rosea TaxID=44941 RepID=A0A397TQ07_9GLOM|nr:hypothetical protein C2G38_2235805 [Gigaspora rosea]
MNSVNDNVISILVYKPSLEKNINSINKNIPKMNFFTQSIKDIINFLKDDIYNKYASKYIELTRTKDFIQFMKKNVKKADDIGKYFKKWQSDREQYLKATCCIWSSNENLIIEEVSKIANNTESAFKQDACFFLAKHCKNSNQEVSYNNSKLSSEVRIKHST